MAVDTASTTTVVTYADPYKQCCECGGWVTGAWDRSGPLTVLPCGHQGDYRDVCPSWGPVDDCQCVEHLGSREHEVPPNGHGVL